MSNNRGFNKESGPSIGFFSLLLLLFIGLKLSNVIAWSWFWVLSPLWAYIILVMSAVAIIVWLSNK